MKKIFTALTLSLLLIGFSTGFVYAETDIIPKDVNEVLKELEKIPDSLTNIKEDINNPELENAIEEVLELQEDTPSTLEKIDAFYERSSKIVKNIADIVERQYNGKKQLVLNTKEVYELSAELQKNLTSTRLEMTDIIKDKDRKIDAQTYTEIRKTTDTLKKEIKENDYIIGEIAKETKNYIVLVKNKNFKGAIKSFEKILSLQDQQIKLLKIINKNVETLNNILINA
ncbi:hypothetical protein [Tissierella praeacuta]|uniref:hypothetical protein n=1 Tax=Tissierella praeacuta TaxID=43131 RepID=UPI003340FF4D